MSRNKWFLLAAVPFVFIFVLGLFFLSASGIEPREPTVQNGTLCIHQRCFSIETLSVQSAEIVNLYRAKELDPIRRINGMHAGSTRLGWFELPSGRRVYVALHSCRDVIYIRTDGDHDLLFNSQNSESLLAELRAHSIDA